MVITSVGAFQTPLGFEDRDVVSRAGRGSRLTPARVGARTSAAEAAPELRALYPASSAKVLLQN
jgi:hypothetical protein